MLDALAVAGSIVTIDAMGCQTEIARTIIARKADYVLALKANYPTLHELVAYHFGRLREPGAAELATTYQTIEKDHGRLEVRRCWATDDPAVLAWLDPERTWPGLRSVAAVEGERRRGRRSRGRRATI